MTLGMQEKLNYKSQHIYIYRRNLGNRWWSSSESVSKQLPDNIKKKNMKMRVNFVDKDLKENLINLLGG